MNSSSLSEEEKVMAAKQYGSRGQIDSELLRPSLNSQFLSLLDVRGNRLVSGRSVSPSLLKGPRQHDFRPKGISSGELVQKRIVGTELIKKIIDFPRRNLVIFFGEGGTGKTTIAGQYAKELKKINPSIEVVRIFFDGICAEFVKRYGRLANWSAQVWNELFLQLRFRTDLLTFAAEKHNLMIRLYQQEYGSVSNWDENIWSRFVDEFRALQRQEELLKSDTSESWLLTHEKQRRYLVFMEIPVLGQYRDFLSLIKHYSSLANESKPSESRVIFLAIAPNYMVQNHAAFVREQVALFPDNEPGLRTWLLEKHKIDLSPFTDVPEDTRKIKRIFRRMAKGDYIRRIRQETLVDAFYVKNNFSAVFMKYLDSVRLPDDFEVLNAVEHEQIKIATAFMLWLLYENFALSSDICTVVFNNLSQEVVNYQI